MSRTARTRNLRVAGALALLAALLTMLYMSRAGGGPRAASAATAVSPVLVATRDLAVGTPVSVALASGGIKLERLPGEALAPTALTHATAVRGQVVIQPIFKGEQVTAGRLGPTGAQGLRANLHGALRAISVSGDANQLLASNLRAGDHVDVVANIKSSDSAGAKTRISLTNLLVLSAPASAATGVSGSSALTATLELTDGQVQKLFWIVKNGDWSLVLRPAAKAIVTANAPTNARDVLVGQ